MSYDGSLGYATRRVEAYRRAAAATSVTEIEALIDAALSEPPSSLRDVEIEALLARLVELDPAGAIRAARSRDLDTRHRLPLYQAWAAVDAESAIAELANESPPARRREIALALLGALGGGAEAFERIARALPSEERESFTVDAFIEQARLDPLGAMEDLLTGDRRLMRTQARQRIAELAVRRDPLAAIEQARRAAPSLTSIGYEAQVIETWIRLDPDAAFDWFESLGGAVMPESPSVLASLAAIDPERLLELADELPERFRIASKRAGLEALAARDPASAWSMIDSTPLSPADRGRMVQSVAATYGRQNPTAALAWARSLSPNEPDAFGHVVSGIAEENFDLAADILIAELENPLSVDGNDALGIAIPALVRGARGRGHAMSDFATRLLSAGNGLDQRNITLLLSRWSLSDVEGAASFAVANAERVDAFALSTLGRQMAARDLGRAIALTDQLPPEQRRGWIEGVARHDADEARRLMDLYITDEAIRRRAAAQIAQIEADRSGVSSSGPSLPR